MTKKKIKILYIAGTSRCGSTILSNILGSIDKFVNVGEIKYLADRGLKENWLCNCGKGFRECNFWNDVLTKAFGGTEGLDPDDWLSKSERGVINGKNIRLRNWLFSKKSKLQERVTSWKEYLSNLELLYKAIQEITGAEVIVDSSKDPMYGYMLQFLQNFDVYYLHLIRNPNAVVYSQVIRKRIQIANSNIEFPMKTSLKMSLFNWMFFNILIERLFNKKAKYMRLKYECLAKMPLNSLKSILTFIDVDKNMINSILVNGNSLLIKRNHIFSGNPSRLESSIKVKEDLEWRNNLSLIYRIIVRFFAFFKMIRYGY